MSRADQPDLSGLITGDGVCGAVPGQLDAEVVRAVGAAFAETVVLPETPADDRPQAVIGHDMRPGGAQLAAALAQVLIGRGVDVIRIGVCSTEEWRFACGSLVLPGAMVTASHRPAGYNGLLLCRAGARPIGQDSGLSSIGALASRYLGEGLPAPVDCPGASTDRQLLGDYAACLRRLVDLSGIRPLTVVVDAGNGMGGRTVSAVLGTGAGLPEPPVEIVPLYFDPDGTFPHHGPDPLQPQNLADLQHAVVARGADLGLAFDGDADRCVVLDENGGPVSASAITALVSLREIAREQAAGHRAPVVVHDAVISQVVPDLVSAAGATAVRARAGRPAMTARMVQTQAVFGGEHSARYYFRDFFGADSGMLAALHVLAALGGQPHPMSVLAELYQPYVASGEIRTRVADAPGARDRVVHAYLTEQGAGPVTTDELDGLTVSHWDDYPQWWFNLRVSDTEPLLYLNVEAADEDIMDKVRDDVLALIRQED